MRRAILFFSGVVVIILVLAGISTAKAEVITRNLTYDVEQGAIFGTSSNSIYQTLKQSVSPFTIQNGDTLVINFTFLSGQGLKFTDNAFENLGLELFPTCGGCSSISSSNTLVFTSFTGDLTSTTISRGSLSTGFVSLFSGNNFTDTMFTMSAGTMTSTINSGLPSPITISSIRLKGQTCCNAGTAMSVVINSAPTADAGPDQAIRAGDTVNLDGSLSFDDNTASVDLDYLWSFTSVPAGSAAALSGADTDAPSFVADVAGTYIVQLIVTDEAGLPSAANQVEISSDNLAPTAAAGDDQLVIIDNNVLLDGSFSSDPEPDPLTYAWTITSKPAGSGSTLSGAATATPSFTPDLEGGYDVELVVSDFLGPSVLPDTVVVTATAAETFAEIQVVFASEVIAFIPPADVTTQGNQQAITQFLRQTMTAILDDDLATAIGKLEKAILRTDGCPLRGFPDGKGKGRDWITECAVQTEVYNLLNDALDALTQ